MYGSIRRMDDEDSEAENDGHQIESNHQEDRSKNEESKNPELSQHSEQRYIEKTYQKSKFDYKEKINVYIQNQKNKLHQNALGRGVKELDIVNYLMNKQIPDCDLQNFLQRLQNDKILDKYKNIDEIMNPGGERRQRRTEAQLD